MSGVAVSDGVSPFSKESLNEAFSFAVGSGTIGSGEAVFDAELRAELAEGAGTLATAVIGEDRLDLDAQRAVVIDSRQQEGGRRRVAFIHQDT